MKRGTPSHPKLLMLAHRLRVPPYVAGGILEFLWHWTSQYAKRGDIGRYPNSVIAAGIGYEGDADELVQALTEEHWLEPHPEHRLIVHDWSEHADDSVHISLARSGEMFVGVKNDEIPCLTRLSTAERRRVKKLYEKPSQEQKPAKDNACVHSVHTKSTSNTHSPAIAIAKPSHRQPTVDGNGLAAVARMVGIGGAAKRVSEVPGMTAVGIVLAAATLRRDGVKDPGAVLAAELSNGPPAIPRVLKPSVVCKMANEGWLAAIAGVPVNESALHNSTFLQIGALKIPAEKLTPDAIVVKGTEP